MRKYLILPILLGLVLVIPAFGGLRIAGRAVDTLRIAIPTLSMPNPNPPIGRNLQRERTISLPKFALDEPETVRVCALRVQFQPDSTSTSTGTGQFDLSEAQNTYVFDPPPHDKRYFESHLEALARYYWFVSSEKIVIEYDIYPNDDSAAYTLPDSMGYYGQSGWYGNNLAARLGGFFTDAVELVDSLDTIPFCEYDVIIIFHAGSDWQNDIGSLYPEYAEFYPDIFIPSPDDLPSAYIVMPEPIVDCIDRGIVVPETCSQDSQIVLLNGVLAHEFGHALGLVDLYSTYDFYTAVGFFSLMDNGHGIGVAIVVDELQDTFDVYGALPVYISAWERAYLGWESIEELTEPVDSFCVRACEMQESPVGTASSARVVKIPIDEFEYFLIENRQTDFWAEGASVNLKQDSLTGVIIGIQVDSEYVGGYDYLLPGSGILIWHIDERVAYGDFDEDGINNFQDNQLQWDWTHPFIDIEEADGIQDIGMWTGGEYAFGTDEDMWRWPLADNFGPYTSPSTENYERGYTGIDIYNISRSDTVMSFALQYIGPHPVWKKTVVMPLESELTIADIGGDDSMEIITTSNGLLLIWTADGGKYVPCGDEIGGIIYDGDTLWYPLPIAHEFDTLTTPVSVGDIDGDELPEIVVCDDNGNIYAFEGTYSGDRLDIAAGYPVQLDGAIAMPAILADIDGDGTDEIIASTNDGHISRIDDGTVSWTYDLHGEFVGAIALDDGGICAIAQQITGRIYELLPNGELESKHDIPCGDLNPPAAVSVSLGSDVESWMVLTSQCAPVNIDVDISTGSGQAAKPLPDGEAEGGIVVISPDGQIADNFPIELPAEPSAPVIAHLIDGKYFQIVFTAETLLYCYHSNGAVCENFPVILYDDIFSAAPIIADADNDGDLDIIAVSEYSRIYAYDYSGKLISSFPLALGAAVSSPAAEDVDYDGEFEIFVGSYEGILNRWNGFGGAIEWGQFGLVSGNRKKQFEADVSIATEKLSLLNFYNYPNPAGEITYFRILLESQETSAMQAVAKINIYNEAGNLISELSDEAQIGVPSEILWETAGVASGIYRAILNVEFDGEEYKSRHIVAVIK